MQLTPSMTIPYDSASSSRVISSKFESDSILPWYVVLVKPRQESLAYENLRRQDFDVYLPQMKVLKRIRGRLECRMEPMFPRYLFVRQSSLSQSIAPVRSTYGVTTLVRFGFALAILRSTTFDQLQAFERSQHEIDPSLLSPFKPGRRVAITDGPLLGLEGLISSTKEDRVVLLMQLLGRDARVTINGAQLRMIN